MRLCVRYVRLAVFCAVQGSLMACATDPRAAGAGSPAAPARAAGTLEATTPASEFVLPAPTTLFTDLAGVIPDATARMLEDSLRMVRRVTAGEIVVVTMKTLPGVSAQQMAQRIGNEWRVGARAGQTRHAGAVVLLIPKESSADGRGHCRIELGNGASAFIPDSAAATMCENAVSFFRVRDYATGLRAIVGELTHRYVEAIRKPAG